MLKIKLPILKKSLLILTLIASNVFAIDGKKMTVYKSPFCGCCTEWTKIMEKKGFDITVIKTEEMNEIKNKFNIKNEHASCHTAIVDGYYIEGHVNYSAIKKLLSEKPGNIVGLSVPGMVVGSPGMEYKDIKKPYNILSINKKGTSSIYEKH